ncbi:MAG TPA: hypothetical protein PKY26_08315, partial [Acetivibrio clariflavus]|nr:hypothetical protein [Acetivibrio clariflavus]
MSKANITPQQRKLDIDIWIIGLTTFAVFALYSVFSQQFMSFVKNDNVPILLRLTVIAALQFGVAGLGITAVCLIRRESFFNFGLKKDNFLKSVLGTIGCYAPLIVYV